MSMFNGLGDRLVVNDDIFDWDTLPESVAVFGPGVIGLELGQALHRLGVRIRIFGLSGSLKPLSDMGIKSYAENLFKDEFPLDTKANILGFELENEQVKISFVDPNNGEEKEELFDNGIKYMLFSHNKKMGSAKGAVLLAEMLYKKDKI